MDIISLFNIINPYWLFLGISLMPLVGYICWANPYEYNSFAECVEAVGGNEGTIMIPNEQAVDDDLEIPVNITMRFIQGGSLNIAMGKTVTIYGHVEAGLHQIFKGNGTATFEVDSAEFIRSEWWGYRGPVKYQKSIYIPKTIFTDIYQSPDIDCHQGYTTDADWHYCIDTAAIYKKDSAWVTIVTNAAPHAGQPTDHLGDGDHYNGNLYIPAETWVSCANFTNMRIFVFRASDLVRTGVHDISAQGHEVAGLVVVPEHGTDGIIYVVSYCDGGSIWKYKLSDFSYLGTISIDNKLPSVHGITYRDNYFYISCDAGCLYAVDLDGYTSLIFKEPTAGQHEGLDYSQDELRWLIDEGVPEKVHYFTESRSDEDGVKLSEFDGILGIFTNPIRARVFRDGSQLNIPNTTSTKVQLNKKTRPDGYDPGGYFDNTVNYRFTAPYSGCYQVNAAIRYLEVVTDKRYYCVVRKNGADRSTSIAQASVAEDVSAVLSDCIYLEKDDYIELFAYHAAGVGTVDISGGFQNTFMTVHLVSA